MNNTNRFTILVAAVLAVAFWTSAGPADASHGWSIGSSFSVGRFDFGVFYQPGSFRGGHDYYYRTASSPRYGGYQCHDRCYRDRGFDYHYSGCPLVHHHFRRYSFNPVVVLDLVFGSHRGHRSHRYYRDYRSQGRYNHYSRPKYRYDSRRYGYRYDGRDHRNHRGRYGGRRHYSHDDDSHGNRRFRSRRDSHRDRGHRYRSGHGHRSDRGSQRHRGRDTRSRRRP
ncbi:MAG: hypothetical protein OES47_08975 [Acidobacteriota bacterium]|nr:hypothetical protein [Acidobacteriota bacterium]